MPHNKLIEGNMQPNEIILWTGQPWQGLLFRVSDFSFAAIGIFNIAISTLWTFLITSTDTELYLRVFNTPIILIVFATFFFKYKLDIKRRSLTHYAVTNQRILIVSLYNNQQTSVLLKSIVDVSLNEMNNGFGTINIGPKTIQEKI
jgi:hypothetical protein